LVLHRATGGCEKSILWQACVRRFLLHISVLAILVAAWTSAYADTLVDRVTITPNPEAADYQTYQLDIHAGEAYTLSISCIEGCASRVSYHEEIDDTPISAFSLRDDSRDIVTFWGTGSAYTVRIYHVGNESISKVMDEGSVSAPQFEVSCCAAFYGDGSSVAKRAEGSGDPASLIVYLSNPDLPAAIVKKWPNFQIWGWDGKRYRMMSGH
jgi:hypothetical protein